jgi:hypothetical protein
LGYKQQRAGVPIAALRLLLADTTGDVRLAGDDLDRAAAPGVHALV